MEVDTKHDDCAVFQHTKYVRHDEVFVVVVEDH